MQIAQMQIQNSVAARKIPFNQTGITNKPDKPRFQGLPGPNPGFGDGFWTGVWHQAGNLWGGITGQFTSRFASFQLGSDLTGYTIKSKILANHLVNWMHSPDLLNPLALLTGGVIGGSLLAKTAGPGVLQALRPDPTPVLNEQA